VYSCSEKKNQGRFRHVGSDHSLVRYGGRLEDNIKMHIRKQDGRA
jgi:hypothetical protein